MYRQKLTEIARRKPQGFSPGGEAGFWWLWPEVVPIATFALPGWNAKA
jgi:hypothetical protein